MPMVPHTPKDPNVNVDPSGLRAHGQKVAELNNRFHTALQAATYLTNAHDGYGIFLLPFVNLMIDPALQNALEGLAKVSQDSGKVQEKLNAVAQIFENTDRTNSGDIGRVADGFQANR